MRTFQETAIVAALCVTAFARPSAQAPTTDPLAVARILAAKYPMKPDMSYISAVSWLNSLKLSALTGESQWQEKAAKDMAAWSAATPAFVEPYRLTTLAGGQAFADLAAVTGDARTENVASKAAELMLPQTPAEIVHFATGWTDDMFMAASVLSRVDHGKHAAVVGRLLTTYASRLQQPDGVFIHATDGPHAWGRGNGFALLGVTEALTHLPDSWSDRAKVLEIYRKHVAAMAKLQSDDGSWRQVVDEPTSYRELTVTAMTTAAMARGVRLGWIDRKTFEPIINKGWAAVAARVNPDGTVKDVCSGTGAQPAREYYLNRPAINGADDRGGAMAMLAAIEVAMLRR
jgi:rhamnogalacturonyl hydrolase YesR